MRIYTAHDVAVSKAYSPLGKRFSCGVQLHSPVLLVRLANLPKAPDVVELERVAVTHGPRRTGFHGQRFLPAIHVSLGPKSCCTSRIIYPIRLAFKTAILSNDTLSTILSAPGGFPAGTYTFNNVNHRYSHSFGGGSYHFTQDNRSSLPGFESFAEHHPPHSRSDIDPPVGANSFAKDSAAAPLCCL
ncbi:hypothetical protein D9M68_770950 [compost metagenome]